MVAVQKGRAARVEKEKNQYMKENAALKLLVNSSHSLEELSAYGRTLASKDNNWVMP
jgi:hypothetical protein